MYATWLPIIYNNRWYNLRILSESILYNHLSFTNLLQFHFSQLSIYFLKIINTHWVYVTWIYIICIHVHNFIHYYIILVKDWSLVWIDILSLACVQWISMTLNHAHVSIIIQIVLHYVTPWVRWIILLQLYAN